MNVDGINLRDAGLQTGHANLAIGAVVHLTQTPLRYTPDGQELPATPEPCIATVLDVSKGNDAGNLLLATVPAGSTFWAWPNEVQAMQDAEPTVAIVPIPSGTKPAQPGNLGALLESAKALRVRWQQASSDLQLNPEHRSLEARERQARQDLHRMEEALKPLLVAEAEAWRGNPARGHRCPEHACLLQFDDAVEDLYSGSISRYRCPLAPGDSCTGLWQVEHSADQQRTLEIIGLPPPEHDHPTA